MTRTPATLIFAAFMAVVLSGCFTATEGNTNFTVDEDAPPHADLGGDYTLEVLVTDAMGNPLEGAAVVFFESETDFSGDGWWANAFTSYEPLGAVRTAEDGIGSADLEGPGTIHLAAGGLSNYTVEVLFSVTLGESGKGSVEIPLYPNTISVTQDITVENKLGTAGISTPASENFRLVFDDVPATDAALHERLDGMDLKLSWNNGMTGGADFFVGVAAGDNDAFKVGSDSQQIPGDGANSESVAVSSSELENYRQTIASNGAYGVVLTDYGAAGYPDLPAQFTIEAQFKGSQFTIE